MRNLKRALSLTLASVMLLGMMVIGSSAAKGYPDVDENDNVEAIEVLQAIGVMVGDAGTGNFRPDAPVSRAEMAVVMGLLLNLDYNYYVSTCPFADVTGNYEWARGWVGACAANGIIAGRSATSYDPGATVTAIEAASMMMRALGYFQNAEDYADGFQVVTVRQGSQIGIFTGIGSDATTPMTRNQVAQMALNALESNMVTFTGTPSYEFNGVKVGYRAEYTVRSDTDRKYAALSSQGDTTGIEGPVAQGRYYIQLGEELYNGKLTKQDDVDAFGRPARTWEFDTQDIGTYVKKELLVQTYTSKVEGGEVYSDIGSLAAKYPLSYWQDGILMSGANTALEAAKLVRNNDDAMGATAKGVTTEVYVDSTANNGAGELDIIEINTYLAFATADYNASNEYLPIQVYSYNSGTKSLNASSTWAERLKSEDFEEIVNYKEDDALMVQIADGEVKVILEPTFLEDAAVTRFSQSSGNATTGRTESLTTGGTKYDYNVSAQWDGALELYNGDRLVDATYDIYIDQNGYVIGAQVHSAELRYVFVTSIDYVANNRVNATADASVIFPDGRMDEVTINVVDTNKKVEDVNVEIYNDVWGTTCSSWTEVTSDDNYTNDATDRTYDPLNSTTTAAGSAYNWNTWYSYTMKGNNYVLTPVKNQDHQINTNMSKEAEINSGTNRLIGGNVDGVGDVKAFGNEKSVYITVDTADYTYNGTTHKVISEVTSVGTGIKNVDLIVPASNTATNARGVYYIWNDKEYVIAAIVVGEDNNLNKDYVYLTKSTANAEGNNTNGEGDTYWEFSAIKDGKFTEELIEVGDWSDLIGHGKTVMRVWYNDANEVVKANTAQSEGSPTWENDFADIDRGNTEVVEIGGLDSNPTNGDPDEILVQRGDTLYIGSANATLGKNGLVVANDCSIVVIVDGDVDDSIGNLSGALAAVDYDKGKTTAQTIEYKGNIAAILNEKGEAKVLIFDCITADNDTITPTPPTPPSNKSYVMGYMGNSVGSKNVQIMIGLEVNNVFDHWLTKEEIEDLNITDDDVYVAQDAEIGTKYGLGQEGTVWTKDDTADARGTSYTYYFDDSALAAFHLYEYDGWKAGDNIGGGDAAAEDTAPGAGFLKIHLESALEAGKLTVRVRIDGKTATVSGSDPTLS